MKKILLQFTLGIIILASCQKEFSSENTAITNSIIQDDSTIISKFIDLDTSLISGHDTLDVCTYTYDNLKRIIRIDYFQYDNITGAPYNLAQSIFYYAGSDTLPYKRLRNYFEPVGHISDHYIDTNYYFYSGTRLLKDSTRPINNGINPSLFIQTYSYNNNQITEILTIDLGNAVKKDIVYLTKSNGNLTLQIDSSFTSSNINPLFFENKKYFSFSYDANPNPFLNKPMANVGVTMPYYNLDTYSDDMVYEKNNPVEINETQTDNNGIINNYHYRYSYNYKINGYPSVARVVDVNDPTYFFKRIFVYIK